MKLRFSLLLYSGECPGEGEVMSQKNLGMGALSTFFSLLAAGLCNHPGPGLEGACLTVTGNGAADKELAWAP